MPTFQGAPQQSGVPRVARAMPAVQGFQGDRTAPFSYPYSIAGFTKNSTGTALPGCTVKLFRTADDSLVNQALSNASGYYITPASNLLFHYVNAYLPGSPDVAGTTVNTLIGS